MKNYLLHLRPKSFLPSFTFVLTGYALNQNKAYTGSILFELFLLFLIYSVLLFGGTCAMNSHFDKDTGPLNFLKNPPEKPKYLGYFGFLLMALACVLTWFMDLLVFSMAAFSLFLSLLYSVKIPGLKWRGKEVGIVDNIINALGCGFVGVIMGAVIGGGPMTFEILIVAIAFTLTVAGSYPATQLFQLKVTDNYAASRNFTTLLGPARALRVGAFLMLLGLIVLNVAQTYIGITSEGIWLITVFHLLFLFGVLQTWRWSNDPFTNTEKKYKTLVASLLGARLFWIAAQWMIN